MPNTAQILYYDCNNVLACDCEDCAEWRSLRVQAVARELCSRLDYAVIREQQQEAADSWALDFFRARLSIPLPENTNNETPTRV
jgi:hypothetical protein